jgi:antitoxin MazE
MQDMRKETIQAAVNQWGNGLAVRLTKSVARIAGVKEGTRVRIVAQKGRIVIETEPREPTLEEMLAAFDPTRHGGELRAFEPVGKEVL